MAVMFGGAVGALVRWRIGQALPEVGGLPVATFAVNVSGAFALGLLGVLLAERLPQTRYLRPLVGIGFLGAYTTFSTMAVEGVRLIAAGRVWAAAGYWLATLVAGQMAGVYGMWLGRVRAPGGGDQAAGRGMAGSPVA